MGREQPRTRVDDGVREGGEVSMFYDPMIAKLVTWAPTREAAIDAQVAALDRFEIAGPGTNLDFLSALMQHPRFRAGELTTGFIAEEYPDGFHGAPASGELLATLARVAAVAASAEAERAARIDGQLGGRLPTPTAWSVRIGDAEHQVLLGGSEWNMVRYEPGDRVVEVRVPRQRPGSSVEQPAAVPRPAPGDGGEASETLTVRIARTRTGFRLSTRGATHDARVLPARLAPYASHMVEKVPPDLSRFLLAPMPGLLTRLEVTAGERVEAGQPLAVVEAMKMENILRATKAGTVKALAARPGDSLAVDAVILELE